MLNGIAPIIIFSFPFNPKGANFNAISGIPLVGSFIAKNVGIPIPIYLDERVSGICVVDETKSIDVDTNPQQPFDIKTPIQVTQKGINSIVTVNMVAQKDSILLATLLALNDMIFARLVSQEYSITYLNGPTTIFDGLLHGFSSSQESNDDLVRVSLQISKANQKTPSPGSQINIPSIAPFITGSVSIVPK
jgi:hypothetical protein